jgi:hypothetical protein
LDGRQDPSDCGVDDSGQHVPDDVSCESTQDAARPPPPGTGTELALTPGNWQVSSPVGVEPHAQHASPSDVMGPGQLGAATAAPPQPKIAIATAKSAAAIDRLWMSIRR